MIVLHSTFNQDVLLSCSFIRFGYVNISTTILSLPLIQEKHILPVTDERTVR